MLLRDVLIRPTHGTHRQQSTQGQDINRRPAVRDVEALDVGGAVTATVAATTTTTMTTTTAARRIMKAIIVL